jgi:hypothetical protein
VNIQLFGLTVDGTGAISTIRSVTDAGARMAQDGAKSAQLYADAMQEKLNRVARQYIPETMRAIDALGQRNRVLAVSNPGAGLLTAEEVARGVAGYDALIGKSKEMEVASGGTFTGMGRIRQGLTSLVAQMTGTIPVLDRIVASFGSMAAGSSVVIGVLAALAAVAFAYRALTRDARDAAEAQDAALKKQEEWYKKRHLGPAGEFGDQQGGAVAAVGRQVDRRGALSGLAAAPGLGGLAGLIGMFATETDKQFGLAVRSMAEGGRELGSETTKVFLDQRATEVAMLAANIKSNNATHAERLRANDLLKQDMALRAQYTAAGGHGEVRSALSTQIESLDSALHPEVKSHIDRAALAAAKEEDRTKAMLAGADAEVGAAQRVLAAYQKSEEAGKAREREETILLQLTASGLTLGTERYAQMEKDIRQTYTATDALAALAKARKEESDAAAAAEKARAARVQKAGADFAAEQKRQADHVQGLLRGSFATFFSDIVNHGKGAFASLFDAIKQGFVKLIADMLAVKAGQKLAGLAAGLGMALVPGTAYGMSGASGHGGIADASDISGAGGSAWGGYATAGLASFGVGAGLGASSKSMGAGAASGALGGALTGFALGGPVGAAIGGLAGLAGGILGFGAASRAAAKQLAEAQTQLALTMAALRAEVGHDSLGASIASENAKREQLRKQIEDAFPGGGSGSEQVAKRNAALAEMNALEDTRVQQLREEYALGQARFAEDLRVRMLVAQNRTREADALRLQLAQEREMQDAIKNHTDPATLALLAQVQAQEKLYAATHATSQALNTVSGYKIQEQIFNAMDPRRAGPMAPSAPNFSAGSTTSSGPDVPVVLMLDGAVVARSVVKRGKDNAVRNGASTTEWWKGFP